MTGRLAGRVALITGGGAGIGRAVLARFVAEGARVGVLERSPERALALSDDFGLAVCTTVGDVSVAEDNAAAVRRTVTTFGSLDVFVGNAGVYDLRARLDSLEPDELSHAFDNLFTVNVKGYLLGIQAALPHLRRTQGAVVLTASVSSFAAGFGGVLYVAAKHAVAGLTRQLALELAPDVRVNAVAPGYVRTQLAPTDGLAERRASPTPFDPARVPLRGDFGADELTGPYVLLGSDDGRVMTGAILVADGGLSVAGAGVQPG